MSYTLPALEVFPEKCTGRLACLRMCPTHAIRVRNRRISIKPELCIDCGGCIVACPGGAIQARTDSKKSLDKYKFNVAIASSSLYGQFPRSVTPQDIHDGLLALGFDAVFDLSVETELYIRALREYMDEYKGPWPLISSMCPVVVRLLQVSFPNMVRQLVPLQPPREIAGLRAKHHYSKKLGIDDNDIGAIYITPCPAKTASIKSPAEGVKSNLDLALEIRDIYNPLLAEITKRKRSSANNKLTPPDGCITSLLHLMLPATGGLSSAIEDPRRVSVAQLPNIIQVCEDLEKGKIRDIGFLECNACSGGCIGGPLTVDDRFVAMSKLQHIVENEGGYKRMTEDYLDQIYVREDYYLKQPLRPRPIDQSGSLSFIEQIEKIKTWEDFVNLLPGIDCGLCGSPTCNVFANDVSRREAEPSECVMLNPERIIKIRELYKMINISEKEKT